jgi:hypothetical protein
MTRKRIRIHHDPPVKPGPGQLGYAVIAPGNRICIPTVSVDRESAEHFLPDHNKKGRMGHEVRRVRVTLA